MKITLSRSQWENLGKRAGWIKKTADTPQGLESIENELLGGDKPADQATQKKQWLAEETRKLEALKASANDSGEGKLEQAFKTFDALAAQIWLMLAQRDEAGKAQVGDYKVYANGKLYQAVIRGNMDRAKGVALFSKFLDQFAAMLGKIKFFNS